MINNKYIFIYDFMNEFVYLLKILNIFRNKNNIINLMNMIFPLLIINMRKVYVINDFNLKKKVEELGYRCEVMESNIEDYDKAIIVKIRNPSEYMFYEKLKEHFKNKNKILYIVFSPEVGYVSERPKGYYVKVAHSTDFTEKESAFMYALMRNTMTKGVCIDLNITRATYSSYCKKLCTKVGAKDVFELKLWALLNIKN